MAQALFANQREANLQSTIALVEEVLTELGYPAVQARIGTDKRAWKITKGSATAHVSLLDRSQFTHIRVSATVMTIDANVDRTALYSHLLELNAGLAGAAFATDHDQVLLVAERSTLDLDRSEVRDLVLHVTTTADDHDDVLVARFGGTMGG
ncbi:MAG: YbjN domain-containing protein [Kofleriaceae bacterium]